jgi:hypothetical protein
MGPRQRNHRDRARRCPWLVATALASVLLTWAAPPVRAASDAEKPAPDTAVHPDRQELETIIRKRYPQLVTQKFSGVPVVTVLETYAKDASELTVSRLQFSRFGLKEWDLSYIGLARFELPLNTVIVMFGGKSTRDPDRS